MKLVKNQLLIVMFITTSVITLAQQKPANPFGLVYGDAITENVLNVRLSGVEAWFNKN